MNLTVIGAGYVGLVSGACFANVGHRVMCLDIDKNKIRGLKKGKLPIYEKKLQELVKTNYKEKRLYFSTNCKEAINFSDVIFIAVDTPSKKNGEADLSNIENVCNDISKYMEGHKIIVEKSTVPVGTFRHIKKILNNNLKKYKKKFKYSIVSNPEFLKEGNAVDDFMKPDRIIIGHENDEVCNIFKEIYAPFNRRFDKIQFMDISSAELTKYAANALLATKISFINEMSNIADRFGVDIENVRKGIGADKRIGYDFLYPGCGYGGSCLPKDVQALVHSSKEKLYEAELLIAVDNVNKKQKLYLFDKLNKFFNYNLKNKNIAIWGLAFKPDTNDTRSAPSLTLIESALNSGANVCAYDPIASIKQSLLNKKAKYKEVKTPFLALKNADALLICTEWKEFWSLDLNVFKKYMKNPVIFDGRNIYSHKKLKEKGVLYFGTGRGEKHPSNK